MLEPAGVQGRVGGLIEVEVLLGVAGRRRAQAWGTAGAFQADEQQEQGMIEVAVVELRGAVQGLSDELIGRLELIQHRKGQCPGVRGWNGVRVVGIQMTVGTVWVHARDRKVGG